MGLLDGRRIVFLGTPEPAAEILSRLVTEGFDVGAVVTRPDARRGRGSVSSPSPVKRVASEHGIEVLEDVTALAGFEPGRWFGVVVAFGRIVPESVLARVPMVNVHFSLLPRWRGAAPVERAILAGDATTGVCIMDVVRELDAGGVRASRELVIGDDSAPRLMERLTRAGADLLVEVLRAPESPAEPQVGEITHAAKIDPTEAWIDWSLTAVEVWRRVRALRACTALGGRRLVVHEVEIGATGRHLAPGECDEDGRVGCADGAVQLVSVQPEGRSAMDARSWRRGVRGEVRFHGPNPDGATGPRG